MELIAVRILQKYSQAVALCSPFVCSTFQHAFRTPVLVVVVVVSVAHAVIVPTACGFRDYSFS